MKEMKSIFVGLCFVGLGVHSLPAVEPPLWINVTPLLEGRSAATADDLAFLTSNTIIDGAAYTCSLVPEGDPAVDKAAIYARRYRETAPIVKSKCGIRQGILFQSTMGHGWTPNAVTPWQTIVMEGGGQMYKFCPLDTRFLDHMSAQAKTLADLAPDFFMVDDDTRLITGVRGCYCPLHLAEFAKRTGRKWTREEIIAAVREDAKLAKAWDLLLADSIAGLMERIRAAFPSSIPGIFCCCAQDAHHAARMARILSAPGQRPVVRINGAPYCQELLYDGLARSSLLAREMADIGPGVTILSESDTCPQNRYATSATRLLDYMETMTFDGCDGAKIWLTRGGNPHELESGRAYRKLMAERKGLLKEISGLELKRCGVTVPLPERRPLGVEISYCPWDWGTAYFGRSGFPFRTGRVRPGDVAALLGEDLKAFTDAELTNLLSGAVLLDGAAARGLTARGFSSLIGVTAREWAGKTISAEDFGNERLSGTVNGAADLTRHDPAAQECSRFLHTDSGLVAAKEYLAPGSLQFVNRLGGRIAVLAPDLPLHQDLSHFVYFTETRKRQMAKVLRWLGDGQIPGGAYYVGDAPVWCKAGTAKTGGLVLYFDNLDLDAVEPLAVRFDAAPKTIERLCDDGVWRPMRFTVGADGVCEIPVRLETMRPVILRANTERNGK